uniref:DUF6798 domain-containing protein n=1 Tax=Schlesneria paludicola TaxID=360056 RepID=A0A7C2NUJ0_9PLAN
MPDGPRDAGSTRGGWESAAVAGSFLLYAAIAAPVPALNEPHYLAKAKHFWNPDWCAGDLFLQSANAHTVFFVALGWLTLFLPLPAVAWIGRVTSLALLAGGWTAFTRQLIPQTGAALLSAWLFLGLQSIGNFSGEWVIGGVESKVYAFAALFWAAAWMLQGRPNLAAAACGVGIAFHPVVGLWTLLAVIGAWLARRDGFWRSIRLRPTAVGVAVLVLTALPGMIPVVQLLTAAVDPTTRYTGTYLQVFHRLGHHLDPMQFPRSAYVCYLGLLMLWLIGVIVGPRTTQWRWLHRAVLWAVIFAVVGVLVGWGPRPPNLLPGYEWRMHLLKFYPFRLADALLPMAVAWLATWTLSAGFVPRRGMVMLGVLVVAATLWRGFRLAQAERYRASQEAGWLDACRWMREHAPRDAVVHTPHFRWTFKWYAERAEYATFKDCPQDVAGIVEWNRRLLLLTRRFQEGFADGVYTWEELQALRAETGITHIVTDRLGPMDFPPVYQNGSFRVYDLVADREAIAPQP